MWVNISLLFLLLMLLNNSWITTSSLMEQVLVVLRWLRYNWIARINVVVIVNSANVLSCVNIIRVIDWSYTEIVHISVDHELNSWDLSCWWLCIITTIIFVHISSICSLKCCIILLLRVMSLLKHILRFFQVTRRRVGRLVTNIGWSWTSSVRIASWLGELFKVKFH